MMMPSLLFATALVSFAHPGLVSLAHAQWTLQDSHTTAGLGAIPAQSNALSLPMAVGPKGRLGKLRRDADGRN